MVLFILGTSSVMFLGRNAKQDAWIAVVIGSIVGMILYLLIHGLLFKSYPDLPFTKIFEKILGKVMGKILSFLYVLYLLFLSSLVLRYIYEMLVMYVLAGTPKIVLIFFVASLVIYAVLKGFETMSRTAELYFFSVILAYITFIILILLSDIIELKYLFPILEDGFKPVIKEAVPLFLGYPFGELCSFLYIYPLVNKKKMVIKVGLLAILSTSFILILLTVLSITTIGIYWSQNSPFPILKMIRLINVGDILQRFDSLAVLIFLTGSIFKLGIFCYATNSSLQDIFNTKKYTIFLVPTGILVITGSYLIANNYTTYIHLLTKHLPFLFNLPFEIVIPIILILINFVKKLIYKIKNS